MSIIGFIRNVNRPDAELTDKELAERWVFMKPGSADVAVILGVIACLLGFYEGWLWPVNMLSLASPLVLAAVQRRLRRRAVFKLSRAQIITDLARWREFYSEDHPV